MHAISIDVCSWFVLDKKTIKSSMQGAARTPQVAIFYDASLDSGTTEERNCNSLSRIRGEICGERGEVCVAVEVVGLLCAELILANAPRAREVRVFARVAFHD